MKKLYKAVLIITIFSIITRLLGFLFHIYLSRTLTNAELGIYQVAFSILGVLITIVSSGIPVTTAKLCSFYDNRYNPNKKAKIVGNAFVISIITSIILIVITFLSYPLLTKLFTSTESVYILMLMLPSIFFSAIYSVFRGAMWGENKYFSISLLELIEQVARIIFTILLFLLFKNITNPYLSVANGFNLACIVASLCSIILYFSYKGKFSIKRGEYKNIIKSSSFITGIRLASSAMSPLTALIVPAGLIVAGYTTTESLSLYGIMMGMTISLLYIPMTVVGSISTALIPNISANFSKKKYNRIKKDITQSFYISILLAFISIALYTFVGKQIGIVLFNNALSGELLSYSAIVILPIVLCSLSSSILNGLGLESQSFKNYLIGAVIMIISLYILTRLIGIMSISISMGIGMLIVGVLNIRTIYSKLPDFNMNLFKKSTFYLLLILPTAILSYNIVNILDLYLNTILTGLISGSISLLFYIMSIHIFGIFNIKTLFKKNKKIKV